MSLSESRPGNALHVQRIPGTRRVRVEQPVAWLPEPADLASGDAGTPADVPATVPDGADFAGNAGSHDGAGSHGGAGSHDGDATQRVVRVPGSRRVRLTSASGTDPEPRGVTVRRPPASESNDARLKRDVPPHY